MTKPAVIGAIVDAWDDLDRVYADMDADEAQSTQGGSAFAWTLAHLANQVDGWINVRCAGAEPNPVVADAHYRFGGDGRARGWNDVRKAWASIRRAAAAYLEGLEDADLDRTQPYPGSLPALKGRDVPLRHTLLRILAHTYFHIGEVGSKRSTAGRLVGDYPGPMLHALETDR